MLGRGAMLERRRVMHPTMLLLCAAVSATGLFGQATAATAGSVPCSVRIRPKVAADYDPGSEMLLRGPVTSARDGILKVRLPFGVVHIQVGTALDGASLGPGQVVEVLASKRQDDRSQWFVAREVRSGPSTLVLRDSRGVPVR